MRFLLSFKPVHARGGQLPVSKVRRLTDYPYLPRVLIFELIELVSGANTYKGVFKEWSSQNKGFTQMSLRNAKEVGCSSVVKCNVHAIHLLLSIDLTCGYCTGWSIDCVCV